MKTIETNATVTADGKLIAEVPGDVRAGEHKIVIVIQDTPKTRKKILNFPVDHYDAWPPDLSLSREDLYGDNGR